MGGVEKRSRGCCCIGKKGDPTAALLSWLRGPGVVTLSSPSGNDSRLPNRLASRETRFSMTGYGLPASTWWKEGDRRGKSKGDLKVLCMLARSSCGGLGEDLAVRYSVGEMDTDENELRLGSLERKGCRRKVKSPSSSLARRLPGKKGIEAGLSAALLAMILVDDADTRAGRNQFTDEPERAPIGPIW